MENNLYEAKYDITKKTKLRKFYESNKILIYLVIFILIVLFIGSNYYLINKNKKRELLSENYIQAKILDQKEIPKLSYLNSFLNECLSSILDWYHPNNSQV